MIWVIVFNYLNTFEINVCTFTSIIILLDIRNLVTYKFFRNTSWYREEKLH